MGLFKKMMDLNYDVYRAGDATHHGQTLLQQAFTSPQAKAGWKEAGLYAIPGSILGGAYGAYTGEDPMSSAMTGAFAAGSLSPVVGLMNKRLKGNTPFSNLSPTVKGALKGGAIGGAAGAIGGFGWNMDLTNTKKVMQEAGMDTSEIPDNSRLMGSEVGNMLGLLGGLGAGAAIGSFTKPIKPIKAFT